jgi:hypothetical protein
MKKIFEASSAWSVTTRCSGRCTSSPSTCAPPPDLFREKYPFLDFDPLEHFELPVGIDDQAWLPKEDEEEVKALDAEVADKGGLEVKKSNQPQLSPIFPGFGLDVNFRASFISSPQLHHPIPQREFPSCGFARSGSGRRGFGIAFLRLSEGAVVIFAALVSLPPLANTFISR